MTHFFRSVFFAMVLANCAAPLDSTESIDSASTEQEVSRSPYRALSSGTRTTLVEGIISAENLLFTSDNRLLASGDNGIFEVLRDPNGAAEAVLLTDGITCKFLGMTEIDRVIYANCSDFTSSAVYAANLAASPVFKLLVALPDVAISNGLTHDDAHHLFVAATMQNEIVRITISPSDPFQASSPEVWLSGSGVFTNAMKVADSTLYWTDFGGIKYAKLFSNGNAGSIRTLASSLTFFDDLSLDDNGLLVADYMGNTVRAYTARGRRIAQTPAVFSAPSAVLPAQGRLGLGSNDLVVSEKAANQVAVYSPNP